MTAEDDSRHRRRRPDLVLTPGELAAARGKAIALAYDPVRIGWVAAPAAEEAEEEGEIPAPLSWQEGPAAAVLPGLPKRFPGTPVPPAARGIAFRPWGEEDLPVYRVLMTDPELWRHMPEEPPAALSDEDLAALIALSSGAPHHRVRAILEEGVPVGQVRLELSPCGRRAELSYWLGPAARGRGLGRVAVARFLEEMLPLLPGLEAVTARVHPDNAASARILADCGFQPAAREVTGLGPRGRDRGDWPVFIRRLRPPEA